MTNIVELKEPFKTFFAKLDMIHFTPCEYTAGHLKIGGGWVNAMPNLDPEECKALAAELDAAIQPILKRFKQKKLAEVMTLFGKAGEVTPDGTIIIK